MEEAEAILVLVNSGSSERPYGVETRKSLKIITAPNYVALDGELVDIDSKTQKKFGLEIPVSCPELVTEVLNPINTWGNISTFYLMGCRKATLFI